MILLYVKTVETFATLSIIHTKMYTLTHIHLSVIILPFANICSTLTAAYVIRTRLLRVPTICTREQVQREPYIVLSVVDMSLYTASTHVPKRS